MNNNKGTQLINEYKGRMTWADFAQAINRTPGLKSPITRPQVNNWGVGVGLPEYYFLKHLEREGEGWVSRMAGELLKIISE